MMLFVDRLRELGRLMVKLCNMVEWWLYSIFFGFFVVFEV